MEQFVNDAMVIFFIAGLEGLLSVDNAIALAVLAKHLPPHQQKKALAYGLWGAIIFRFIALASVTYLMKWIWIKILGGLYLLYLAIHYFWKKGQSEDEHARSVKAGFWKTVFLIEVTDIAFAADSILAAVALTPKFWLVFLGGVLGVIMMRFAAAVFMKLLQKFPKLEVSAYLMVGLIGAKLLIDAGHWVDFHSSTSPATWIFWGLMAASLGYGFVQKGAQASNPSKADSTPS